MRLLERGFRPVVRSSLNTAELSPRELTRHYSIALSGPLRPSPFHERAFVRRRRLGSPPASTQLNRYFMESLLPLEFEYGRADIDETVKEIDTESLESLPYGLQGFQQAPAF